MMTAPRLRRAQAGAECRRRALQVARLGRRCLQAAAGMRVRGQTWRTWGVRAVSGQVRGGG